MNRCWKTSIPLSKASRSPESAFFLDLPVHYGSFVSQKRIAQVHWPKDCLITNVERGRETLIPHGDLVLLPGDTLTFLCKAGTKRICESSLRQL